MPVPSNISREHVLQAIIRLERQGVPNERRARAWFLEYEGRLYPVKYVVSLANEFANNVPLDPGSFTTEEAVRLLRRLGFNVVQLGEGPRSTEDVIVEVFEPDNIDIDMYHALEAFTSILERRLRIDLKRSSTGREEAARMPLNESTMRFLFLHVLSTLMPISVFDVYLEYPYGLGDSGAKMDVFIEPRGGSRPIALEIKTSTLVPSSTTPAKTENAGRVFADILRLARLGDGVKRYFVYILGRDMIVYYRNKQNRLDMFFGLGVNEGFRLRRSFFENRPESFIRVVKEAVGDPASWPEPLVVCRFSRDLEVDNIEVAIRVYEVKG